MKIYTIGHSDRPLKDFINLLKERGIEVLIDIRSYPTSVWEHFTKESLEKTLKGHGLRYLWLGELLGGLHEASREDYDRGVQEILKLSSRNKVAIMCAEKDPLSCHRLRISSELEENYGATVLHIIDKGVVYRQHKLIKYLERK